MSTEREMKIIPVQKNLEKEIIRLRKALTFVNDIASSMWYRSHQDFCIIAEHTLATLNKTKCKCSACSLDEVLKKEKRKSRGKKKRRG